MSGYIELSPFHLWGVSNSLHALVIEKAMTLAMANDEPEVAAFLEPRLYIQHLVQEDGDELLVSERALELAGEAVEVLLSELDPSAAVRATLQRCRDMYEDWRDQCERGIAIDRRPPNGLW